MAVVEQATILKAGLDASGFEAGAAKVTAASERVRDTLTLTAAAGQRSEKVTLDQARAWERLQQRMDPVAKAQREYERAEAGVQQARMRGLATQEQGNRVLDLARERLERASKSAGDAAKGIGSIGPAAASAGMQLQDVFTQISMGGNALQAIGIQGAQFLGMFGAAGAIAGAGLALGAVAASMIGVKTEQERLTEALDKAEDVWKNANTAAEQYRSGLAAEAEKVKQLTTFYGQLSEAQREVERIRLERTRAELAERSTALRQSVTSRMGGRLEAAAGGAPGMDLESQLMGGIGGPGAVPAQLNPAIDAVRKFREEQNLTVEGASRLIQQLTEMARAGGTNAREIIAQRDALVDALPQIKALEEAEARAAAQAEALGTSARNAGAGVKAMAGDASSALGTLLELTGASLRAQRELETLRQGGPEALAALRRQQDAEEEARQARDRAERELQSQGHSREDAQRLAAEGEAERRRLIDERRATERRQAQETELQRSRQQLAEAERIGATPDSMRSVVVAQIQAENRARELGLEGLERERYIREQVQAATMRLTEASQRHTATTEERTEALTREALAWGQSYEAGLRAAAQSEAQRRIWAGEKGSLDELTQSILNANAARSMSRAGRRVGEDERDAAGELRVAEAARQGPAAERQAELAEQTRRATEEWRAFRDAVTDPSLKQAWDDLIQRYEKMAGGREAARQLGRSNATLAEYDRRIRRSGEDAGLVFASERERGVRGAISAERDRIEREGGDTESAVAEERMTKAAQAFLADDSVRKLEELRDTAMQFGEAMAGAFEDAVLNGKSLGDVVRGLERDLIRMLSRMAMQQIVGGITGGSTGGWGSLVGAAASLFHEGGVAGGPAPVRYVHPAVFDGAPQYRTGGIAGVRNFAADEIPAILHRSEVILNARQQAAVAAGLKRGAGGGIAVNQTIIAKDADSFRANRNTMLAELQRGVMRASRNT